MSVIKFQLLETYCWKIYWERDVQIILKGRKGLKTLVKHQLADKIEGYKKKMAGDRDRWRNQDGKWCQYKYVRGTNPVMYEESCKLGMEGIKIITMQ